MDFWLGNKISLVDLHYAPFFERFGAFKTIWCRMARRMHQNIKMVERHQKRDSYKMTVLPTEEHVDLYRSVCKTCLNPISMPLGSSSEADLAGRNPANKPMNMDIKTE